MMRHNSVEVHILQHFQTYRRKGMKWSTSVIETEKIVSQGATALFGDDEISKRYLGM
jgi:hypothetical protein